MTSEIAAAGAATVTRAIERASASTGAGFDFLVKMAVRESSLDPSAKAKTSSAAGLYQFIEQTWFGTVKQYGASHGLSDAAADITRGSDGKFKVENAARRQEILNLRFDANASAAMAGELANQNGSLLKNRLGRTITSADLYTAHFLGPAGAVKLLSAGANAKAADLLPQAASANRHVFYDGARVRSVGEVVASIAKSIGGKPAIVDTSPDLKVATVTAGIAPESYMRLDNYQYTENKTTTKHSHTADMSGVRQASETSAPMASRLSKMAMIVLQALNPSQLGGAPGEDRHQDDLATRRSETFR